MTTENFSALEPLVHYLKLEGERPYLCGSRCQSCGHTFVGERQVCANCTSRDRMTSVQLAETGRLYDFTVVYRSFPGVKTPFVDAIVDLDDGSHLKGTLLNVDPDPNADLYDLPVTVVYREAHPVNADGKQYFSYFFVPTAEA